MECCDVTKDVSIYCNVSKLRIKIVFLLLLYYYRWITCLIFLSWDCLESLMAILFVALSHQRMHKWHFFSQLIVNFITTEIEMSSSFVKCNNFCSFNVSQGIEKFHFSLKCMPLSRNNIYAILLFYHFIKKVWLK